MQALSVRRKSTLRLSAIKSAIFLRLLASAGLERASGCLYASTGIQCSAIERLRESLPTLRQCLCHSVRPTSGSVGHLSEALPVKNRSIAVVCALLGRFTPDDHVRQASSADVYCKRCSKQPRTTTSRSKRSFYACLTGRAAFHCQYEVWSGSNRQSANFRRKPTNIRDNLSNILKDELAKIDAFSAVKRSFDKASSARRPYAS